MENTQMYTNPDTTADLERTTLAAVFADRERAHDVIHRLHDEGFRETWLGVTRSNDTSYSTPSATSADDTRVEADNWFNRFFGEGDESLYDALVRRGVAAADARDAGSLAPNSAILTVYGENHPELAAQIISENGGRLISQGFGAAGSGTTRTSAAEPATVLGTPSVTVADTADTEYSRDTLYATDAPLPASDAATALDYGKYRGAETVDNNTRLQLREERLRIDKERRSLGEATVSKDVVTQVQEVDVPLIREELFIERRPVSSAATAAGAIGDESEVVRIPLTQEKLTVTKTPIVTEEVVIGKRQVEEIGHVSETTRKEELNVSDVDVPGGARQMPSDARV